MRAQTHPSYELVGRAPHVVVVDGHVELRLGRQLHPRRRQPALALLLVLGARGRRGGGRARPSSGGARKTKPRARASPRGPAGPRRGRSPAARAGRRPGPPRRARAACRSGAGRARAAHSSSSPSRDVAVEGLLGDEVVVHPVDLARAAGPGSWPTPRSTPAGSGRAGPRRRCPCRRRWGRPGRSAGAGVVTGVVGGGVARRSGRAPGVAVAAPCARSPNRSTSAAIWWAPRPRTRRDSEIPISSMICFARTLPTLGSDSSSAETFILPRTSFSWPSLMTSSRLPPAYLRRCFTSARSRRAAAAFSSAAARCSAVRGGRATESPRGSPLHGQRRTGARGGGVWRQPSHQVDGAATAGSGPRGPAPRGALSAASRSRETVPASISSAAVARDPLRRRVTGDDPQPRDAPRRSASAAPTGSGCGSGSPRAGPPGWAGRPASRIRSRAGLGHRVGHGRGREQGPRVGVQRPRRRAARWGPPPRSRRGTSPRPWSLMCLTTARSWAMTR